MLLQISIVKEDNTYQALMVNSNKIIQIPDRYQWDVLSDQKHPPWPWMTVKLRINLINKTTIMALLGILIFNIIYRN